MIELVNDFPEGLKKFAIAENMCEAVASRLTSKFYVAAAHISEQPNIWCGEDLRAPFGYTQYIQNLRPLTNEVYPVFKLNSLHVLGQICNHWGNAVIHSKDFYQHAIRITRLNNMAYFDGMQIQYDPSNHTLNVLNYPYEGPLVKTKEFPKVNKFISNGCKLLKAELLMEGLISSSDGKIEVPANYKWMRSPEMGKQILKLFHSVFVLEDATFEERVTMSVFLKQYSTEMAQGIGRQKVRQILRATDHSYKWQPGTKRNLYFQYGAYALPEDYQTWFD